MDGSKTNIGNYAGLSVHVPTLKIDLKFKISSNALIYPAEAQAILQSLYTIENCNIDKAVIFIDSLCSLAAIHHISPHKSSPPLIYQIIELWNHLTNLGKSIHLMWVPAHVNIQGNEKADEMAKEAISSGTRIEPALPYSDLYSITNLIMKSKTSKTLRFRAKNNGSKYFELYHGWKSSWFQKLKMNRIQISTLNRMRANHYNLSQSLERKIIIKSGDPF